MGDNIEIYRILLDIMTQNEDLFKLSWA